MFRGSAIAHDATMRTITCIRRTTAALALLGLGTTMALAPPAARAADAPTKLSVSFDGTKLTGFPDKLKGGLTEITMKNTGKFGVDLELLGVQGGHTDDDFKKALAGDGPPKWISGAGGVATTAPGGTNFVLANLDKGNYYWTVSSTGEELNGKQPLGKLSVTGAKSASEPSGGTATITTKEYGFQTKGLKAGVNSVTAINGGKEWHHVIMAKIKAGKTIADVKKELTGNLQGPPQSIDDASTQAMPIMNPGVTYVTQITLQKGSYALVCFLPDKNGKPHVMLGMINEVTIG